MVTGIQIHNWAEEFDGSEPNLEWVAPVNVYAVVDGRRYNLDLSLVPVSTPAKGWRGPGFHVTVLAPRACKPLHGHKAAL